MGLRCVTVVLMSDICVNEQQVSIVYFINSTEYPRVEQHAVSIGMIKNIHTCDQNKS